MARPSKRWSPLIPLAFKLSRGILSPARRSSIHRISHSFASSSQIHPDKKRFSPIATCLTKRATKLGQGQIMYMAVFLDMWWPFMDQTSRYWPKRKSCTWESGSLVAEIGIDTPPVLSRRTLSFPDVGPLSRCFPVATTHLRFNTTMQFTGQTPVPWCLTPSACHYLWLFSRIANSSTRSWFWIDRSIAAWESYQNQWQPSDIMSWSRPRSPAVAILRDLVLISL